MFSKGMSDNQSRVYFQNLVFERMIEDIPSFISDEVKKVEAEILKNAEETAQGDTYPESHTYGDPKTGEWHEEEIEVTMAHSIANSDIRNELIKILEEMPYYFYQAMVAMLWSFAETTLKNEQKEFKVKKTKVEYLFEEIMEKIGHEDLGTVKDLWPNVKEFNDIRNQVIHEGQVKKQDIVINQEYLLKNLKCIHVLLKKTTDAVEEYKQTNKSEKK